MRCHLKSYEILRLKPILQYALVLCFGKVCKQIRKKNARKTLEKCNRLVFYPMHSVISKKSYALGSRFLFFLDTSMLVSKTQGKR